MSAIGRKSLADVVFDRMQRAIKSGAYHPDERLPTEYDLSAEFDVSRPIVREALRRLREQGLIYSRQGAGSFVRVIGLKEPLGFGPPTNTADLLDCYEFRLNIEPMAAALAAARHTAAQMAAISQALELMQDAANRATHHEDADFHFHLAIAQASGNRYFATAMEGLKDHIAVGMRYQITGVKREEGGLSRLLGEHIVICEAIRARAPDLARDRMLRHLRNSRQQLLDLRKSEDMSASPGEEATPAQFAKALVAT